MPSQKRPTSVRRASEFDVKNLIPLVQHPIIPLTSFTWTMEEIRKAKDLQMAGQFAMPARLAESMLADGAVSASYKNRLAPLRCLETHLVPSKNSGGDYVAQALEGSFGPKGVGVSRATIANIQGCFANHGVAIGYNTVTPTADGRRWEFVHRYWPIEFVWWNSVARCFMTRTQNTTPVASVGGYKEPADPYGYAPNNGYSVVPIIHGDGRWTVYQASEFKPFVQDAAIIPVSLLWGIHGHSFRDWAKGSSAHGNAKVVGELPEGVPLFDQNGITPEAASFLELIQAVASLDTPAGIRAFGTKIDYIMNTSSAWQVWDTLSLRAEKLIARAFLGTDGTLGAAGGAPGVDLKQMFNVDTTIVQGDVQVFEDCFKQGVIDPCCAVNFGDSSSAPSREYIVPDVDKEAVQNSYGDKYSKFQAAIKATKENGFVVDQNFVNKTAKLFGVEPPIVSVQIPAPTPALPAPAEPAEQPEQQTEVQPNDEPEPSQGAALAAKMTELQIPRCEHGSVNRCRICGIERERDVELNEEGTPVWAVKWKAID